MGGGDSGMQGQRADQQGTLVLFQQNPNGSEMDKRKKGHGELVIASSDPAKNLEFVEEALNQVTFLISVEITKPWLDYIAFGWDRI